MKKANIVILILAMTPLLYSFRALMGEQEWLNWGNKFLNDAYDPSGDIKIKKWEIMLTPDHFIRLRKTYQQGKQEYFSFNLKRLVEINYLPGIAANDTLQVKTQADDIIMQTYSDPQGDLDSMATMISIPVKKISPAQLDSLQQALRYLKAGTM